MKTSWLAAMFAEIATGCSSDLYPISEIVVEGISQQAAAEYISFRVPEGTECAGVRIRSEGTRRVLSFVRARPEVEVDSVAVVSEDLSWEAMLRVKVPIEGIVLENGGEMTIVFEGGGQSTELGAFRCPSGTQSNKAMQPAGASRRH